LPTRHPFKPCKGTSKTQSSFASSPLQKEVYTPENMAALEAALAIAEAGIDLFNNPNVIPSG
jgi:hypothetical protein